MFEMTLNMTVTHVSSTSLMMMMVKRRNSSPTNCATCEQIFQIFPPTLFLLCTYPGKKQSNIQFTSHTTSLDPKYLEFNHRLLKFGSYINHVSQLRMVMKTSKHHLRLLF